MYYSDADLSPGNSYEFRVRAKNSIGSGATSDVVSFHTFSGKHKLMIILIIKGNAIALNIFSSRNEIGRISSKRLRTVILIQYTATNNMSDIILMTQSQSLTHSFTQRGVHSYMDEE